MTIGFGKDGGHYWPFQLSGRIGSLRKVEGKCGCKEQN